MNLMIWSSLVTQLQSCLAIWLAMNLACNELFVWQENCIMKRSTIQVSIVHALINLVIEQEQEKRRYKFWTAWSSFPCMNWVFDIHLTVNLILKSFWNSCCRSVFAMACEILVGYSIDIYEEVEVDDETSSSCSRVGGSSISHSETSFFGPIDGTVESISTYWMLLMQVMVWPGNLLPMVLGQLWLELVIFCWSMLSI